MLLNEYQERLIEATIELSIVSSNTADKRTQAAATRGYNAIMEYMKDDELFQRKVVE